MVDVNPKNDSWLESIGAPLKQWRDQAASKMQSLGQELKIDVGAAGHVLANPVEDLQVARETYVKPVEELRKTATEYVGKAQRAFDAALELKHKFDHWAEEVCLSNFRDFALACAGIAGCAEIFPVIAELTAVTSVTAIAPVLISLGYVATITATGVLLATSAASLANCLQTNKANMDEEKRGKYEKAQKDLEHISQICEIILGPLELVSGERKVLMVKLGIKAI